MYLCLGVYLLINYGVIKDAELINYLFYGSIVICGLFMFLNQVSQISFNSISIPIYSEIKGFTIKETLLYALPLLIGAPFLGFSLVQIVLILGGVYAVIRTTMRPPDVVDYAKNNTRHHR